MKSDQGQSDTPATRLTARAFAPVPIAFLVYFRILFGGLNLVLVWLYYAKGMIERYYITPEQHFTYYGFGWVHPWPGTGMYWHYAALALLSVLVMVGFCYRFAIVLLWLALTHLFLIEQARYLNHYYLNVLVALILIFLPAHRALSLDAFLRPHRRAGTTAAWTLWILQFQVGIVYFFAGLAKFNWDWLTGLVLKPRLHRSTDLPLLGPLLGEDWMSLAMSYGGLLLDLLVVPLLLWKRTRLVALFFAAAFHVTNAIIFNIDIFPWFMLGATYLLFFSDRMPLARWITGRQTGEEARSVYAAAPSRSRRVTLAVLAVYALIQIALPLRHHLYSGDPNWTERGHYFAWRMMMRFKTGYIRQITATSRDPDGQLVSQEIEISKEPVFWARHWQFKKVARTPDMILQICHRHADALRRQGHTHIDIRADVVAMLNGRSYQQLIDPSVNLANASRSPVASADWIVALQEPRPSLRELSRKLKEPIRHREK